MRRVPLLACLSALLLSACGGDASDAGDGTPWWPWAVGGVLLVIAVAGGTIAWGRRRDTAS